MTNHRKKILFVCLGNICRSAAAEGIMREVLRKEELEEEVEIDSAGTSGYHKGELPDKRMRMHAARRGYELTHRSRPVRTEDFYEFDWIIGMDDRNIASLHQLAPSPQEQEKIYRMCDFALNKTFDHVPDPYYGGASGFENVLDILEDACEGLILRLKGSGITRFSVSKSGLYSCVAIIILHILPLC